MFEVPGKDQRKGHLNLAKGFSPGAFNSFWYATCQNLPIANPLWLGRPAFTKFCSGKEWY